MQHWCSFQSREVVKMVGGNQVPRNDEIGTVQEAGPDGVASRETPPDQFTQEYLRATERRTVGFQPQDGVTDQTTQLAGYDRNLGYERIAVADTPMARRIDEITNLLARGERSAGNLQEVNRYYGRAQKEADDLFSVAALNIMQGREDYRAILAAKDAPAVFAGVEASIQKQAQALQQQLQQEQDPARQRRLAQLLTMEEDRIATLERMKQTTNPQERNRLLMYDAFTAQRIDLSHKMLNERNPAEVKLMAEAEMNLHTVQRAPGFTRANYGMLLMRLGQYDPNRPDNAALRALQDAASVDPEMVPNPNSSDPKRQMGDPNFMRVAAEITGMSPNDQRFGQVLGPIFNRDINRSPSQTYDTGYSPTVAGDPRNPVRYSQVQNEGFVPQAADNRLAANNAAMLEQQRLTDQTAGVTPLIGGKTPLQRARELSQAYTQTGLTPEIRRGFESAIVDSDKGVSPRVAELQAHLAQLEQKQKELMQQVAALQETPEIKELARQGMAKIAAKSPAEQEQFNTLKGQLGAVTDKAQREQILTELGKISPEFVQVVRTLEERVKPHAEQIQQAAQQIEQEAIAVSRELIGEVNQASATRMEYAEKLMKSDKPEDKELGKRLLVESIAKATPEVQKAFATAAQQLGLTDQDIQRIVAAQPQGDVQRTADGGVVAPQGDQTGVVNNTPAGMLVDNNRRAFDAAQDKKAALAQMQDSFKKAMTDTDTELGQFIQLSQTQAQLIAQMPEADQAKLQKMQVETTPAQERQALQNELMGKYGNVFQLQSQIDAMVPQGGPAQLLLNQFRSRFEYARASNAAGDDATAKTLLTEGFSTLAKVGGKDAAVSLVQERPEVGELATKLGIDANAIFQAAAVEAQTAPGAQTGAAGNLEQMLNSAGEKMQKGDIDGAKAIYEDAIKIVDASFNPDENTAKIKTLQDALESGNLTIEQRFQHHKELSERFGAAYQAYNVRNMYAQILSHDAYGQNAAAEVAFKDAIAAADKVPVEAMKRQMGLLATDMGNFQTAIENAPTKERQAEIQGAQDYLTLFSNTLNGQAFVKEGGSAADYAWVNTQINARKNLASFYVRLVIDKDDQGKPIMKDDGTPRFVVDGSKVFKPEEAMKAIDEAKAKYKALHGQDLDADPTKDPSLLYLTKGIYDNSPAELQRKYSQVTRYFHESVTALPTLAAGVTTALLLSKFRPMAKLAGIAEGATATGLQSSKLWGMSLLGGSAVASATHHTIMTQAFGRTDTTWGQSIAMGTGLTVGGVAALKSSHFFFRNATDDTTAAIFRNSTGKDMTFGGGLHSVDELRVLKADPKYAGAAFQSQIDEAIRINQNNTAILQKQFPKLDITDANKFLRDMPTAGTKDSWVIGGNRIGANSRLGQAIKENAGEYSVALRTPEYGAAFGKRGGILLDPKRPEVIKAFRDAKFNVVDTPEGAVLEMRTVGEAVDVFKKLEAQPIVGFGGNSVQNAARAAREQLARIESSGLAAEANIADNLATATLSSNKGLIEFAYNGGVKEAVQQFAYASKNGVTATMNMSAPAQAGRFFTSFKGASLTGATAGFGSEGYDAMTGGDFSFTDAAVKSVGATALLWGGPKVIGGVRGAIRPLESKVYGDLGWSAYGSGVAGGAALYAPSNYLPAWQQLAFERGSIDPNTGKPYELSLQSAFVTPMWKSTTDNIVFNSLLLGGLAAKPGQAFLAGAPWGKPMGAMTAMGVKEEMGVVTNHGLKAYLDPLVNYGARPIHNYAMKPLSDYVMRPATNYLVRPVANYAVRPIYNYGGRQVGGTAVGFFTGSTWNAMGSKIGGEVGPALATGLAIKSFDTFMQAQNMWEGQKIIQPLERLNEPIVDEKVDAVALQQRMAAAREQQRQQAEAQQQQQLQQQQQQQQEQQQQQQQQQGENSDLVGGAPQ